MRFTYRAAGPVAAAAVLTLLCGCSRAQQDWRAAQQAGTHQASRVFAARHPELLYGKRTIRVRPRDAAHIADDELRDFAREALRE